MQLFFAGAQGPRASATAEAEATGETLWEVLQARALKRRLREREGAVFRDESPAAVDFRGFNPRARMERANRS